jgi:hypothetical protein
MPLPVPIRRRPALSMFTRFVPPVTKASVSDRPTEMPVLVSPKEMSEEVMRSASVPPAWNASVFDAASERPVSVSPPKETKPVVSMRIRSVGVPEPEAVVPNMRRPGVEPADGAPSAMP